MTDITEVMDAIFNGLKVALRDRPAFVLGIAVALLRDADPVHYFRTSELLVKLNAPGLARRFNVDLGMIQMIFIMLHQAGVIEPLRKGEYWRFCRERLASNRPDGFVGTGTAERP